MIETPYTVAHKVLDLVSGALASKGCVSVERCYVGAGLISWEWNICNQLVVVPGRIYRTSRFPSEDLDESRCMLGLIAVPLLISLARCVPTITDSGDPPSAKALDDAHRSILADAAVIWNAVSGPLPDDDWERAAVSQETNGASGAFIAIDTRLTIGVDIETWCP